jgi:flagellar motility protein MotE (MotC chaperone)
MSFKTGFIVIFVLSLLVAGGLNYYLFTNNPDMFMSRDQLHARARQDSIRLVHEKISRDSMELAMLYRDSVLAKDTQHKLADSVLALLASIRKLKFENDTLHQSFARIEQNKETATTTAFASAAKLMENMTPDQAARILRGMPEREAKEVLMLIKKRQAGKILALLEPTYAARLIKETQ